MSRKTEDVSRHILPVSATMVGVCMTVITIMQLIPAGRLSSLADNCLAVDSFLFLASTILSYWSIRPVNHAETVEKMADRFFLLGMIFMVIISFLVAFDLFVHKG